ncbi:MAG: translation initiation factor IF-2 [Kiritimatiellae bacterium]|nr:translation initiation factor IF-2 [Kiritimatiellia bacterium]MDD5519333.1 translation initiation factor IF-2 [Kiritimatiellia bacterium]
MRVHELAKELGVPSKDLLEMLHTLGVEAKNHMTALEDDDTKRLRAAVVKAKKAGTLPSAKKTEPIKQEKKEEKPKEKTPPPAVSVKQAKKESVKPAPKVKQKPEPEPEPEAVPTPVESETPATEKIIVVQGPVVVKEFAEKLGIRPNQLIAELMGMNILASLNERMDVAAANKIAEKHGFTFEHQKKLTEHTYVHKKKDTEETEEEVDKPGDMVIRPPVVTFLGHVDHGKTSLLDKIRDTSVAKSEHGGITQHIGAYTVEVNGHNITFLDTPGHEAFTAMRARGANMTDIAVIVIAADDGIMPQTKEAIQHAKAADVSIMVAINKIDLRTASAERVKQQLQGVGLAPEEWGGDTICSSVSAITGEGVPHLLEMILLQAEILELKANPKLRATGYVIEARLEPGMGPVINLLVTSGTLHVGDALVCGQHWGRVRALINDHGVKLKSAGPSMPVKCLGLSGVPEPGAEFKVCSNDRVARSQAIEAAEKARTDKIIAPKRASLEDLFSQIKKDNDKLELKLVLKADTQGSVEAIMHSLQEIKSAKVSLNSILAGTGNITVNDVMLASASNAVVIGFHVAKEPGADAQAKREGIEIRLHTIIYELLDEVRNAMEGLLAPQVKEKVIGHAEVREIFSVGKQSKVAGCYVTDGLVTSRCRARVKRGKEILYQGSLVSLKHFREDVSMIRENQECGVRLDNFSGFDKGDVLEFYELEEIKQTL